MMSILFVGIHCATAGGEIIVVDDDGPADFNNIQDAIDYCWDGDIVIVKPGTYPENIHFDGKSITLRSIDPIDANVVAATVIDGNDSGTVVTFPDNASAVCVLAGLTITNGNSSGHGGGILCLNGAIGINNCVISGNSAAGNGGGIASQYADLTLAGCTFSQNRAYASGLLCGGGGIFTDLGELTVTDCQFSENEAAYYGGGGIRSLRGVLRLTNCSFNSNSAAVEGGGVATDYNSVILTNCTFTGNSAQRGGGMHNSHWGATATNCIFSSNLAEQGGGICTKRLYLGDWTLRLSNCTFSENTADSYGGAVDNRSDGNLVLSNCILWGNIAYNEGPQIAMENNGTVSVSYCCLQGDKWDVYTGGGAALDWGDGNIDDDPCFANPNNGDYHLPISSPCIDAGNNNSLPADLADLDSDGNTIEPIPFDLDGNARIVDGNSDGEAVVDLGAYEYAPSVPLITLTITAPSDTNVARGSILGPIEHAVTNASDSACAFLVGRYVIAPGGFTKHWQVVAGEVPAETTIYRIIFLPVPIWARVGTYTYGVELGDSEANIIDSDSFEFTVEPFVKPDMSSSQERSCQVENPLKVPSARIEEAEGWQVISLPANRQ